MIETAFDFSIILQVFMKKKIIVCLDKKYVSFCHITGIYEDIS